MRVFKYLVVIANDDAEAEALEEILNQAVVDTYVLLESTTKEVVE